MHYRTSDTYNVPKVRLYDFILINILFLYKIMMYYQILEYMRTFTSVTIFKKSFIHVYRSTRTVVQVSDACDPFVSCFNLGNQPQDKNQTGLFY